MYHTGNYLQRKHTTPSIPHGSHLGATQWGNPFEAAMKAGEEEQDDGPLLLRMNHTLPTCCSTGTTDDDDNVDMHEITRTGSGALFFRRKRTTQEQRILSRQRASEMIAQYELSEDKQDSLNRKGNFGPTSIPSIGEALAGHQLAMARYYSRNHHHVPSTSSSSEPTCSQVLLLGDKERDEWDKRTAQAAAATPGAADLSRPPLIKQQDNIKSAFSFDEQQAKPKKKTRAQQRIEIARATRIRLVEERAAKADRELPKEIGVDLVPISPGGMYSVASTWVETPTSSVSTWTASTDAVRTTQEVHRLC